MKKLALLLGIFSILLFGSIVSATIYTCDSCSSCQTALNGASTNDIIQLNASFSNSGSCVTIPIDNVTLDCQGFTITGNNPTGNGIFIDSRNYVTVQNCIVKDFKYGFNIHNSNNNNISDIIAYNNSNTGLYLFSSSNNNIVGANISDNPTFGIRIYATAMSGIPSSNNSLTNMTVNSNGVGFFIYGDSHYNSINDSLIENNEGYGVQFGADAPFAYPTYNIFYNNIFNNTADFYSDNGYNVNYWNTTNIIATNIIGGMNIGGNFWTNPTGTGYSQTCTNADNNSFCDSPYALDASNTDFLPLTLNIPDTTPPSITIASPQNISYNIINIVLQVSANETIDTWWYSLNMGTNITFTPNITITAMQGSNNVRIWANDTVGNLGESLVIYFFVDSVAPNIVWNTPSNSSFTVNSSEIDWNVSLGEIPVACLISINGSANSTMTIDGSYCYYDVIGFSNSTTYCAEIYANDSFGNLGISGVQCATVSLTSFISHVAGSFESTLSEAGGGLGTFFGAITSPVTNIILALGIIGGILAVIFGIGSAIRRTMGGDTQSIK